MARNDNDAAAAAAQNDAAARAETAEKERLKNEAAKQEGHEIKSGNVDFEYSVREATSQPRFVKGYTPKAGEVAPPDKVTHHELVTREKGTRESLPRDVALRKQRQGLGRILGEASPVATTMADLVNRDPLAPREPKDAA